MKGQQVNLPATQFLSGWKGIANYLGKGVRTVQRYERDFGLPVRRPAGKPWGSVVATKAELDAWVMASPIRETFRLTRLHQDSNAASAIQDNIRKMNQLRQQMAELRKDVHLSLHSLRESVYSLQGNLNKTSWRQTAATYDRLESYDRSQQIFDLPHMESKKQKAS